VSTANRGRSLGLLLWAAYLVVPTDAGGVIHGIPLGPIDAAALMTVGWLAWDGRRLSGAPILAALLAVSMATAAAIPGSGGFRARYFANASATGPHERSTEYPDSVFTRIDERLHFAPGGPEFPLAFFNDNSRFNFYRADEPHRRRLEFAVSWSGLWWVDAGRHHLYVDAPAAVGEVFVDGARIVAASPDAGSASAEISLTGGWHRLDVRFSSPYAGPRQFSAGIIAGDTRRPFDASTVVTQQIRGWQMTSAQLLRAGKTVADVAVLGWLAWLFATSVRRRAALGSWRASPTGRWRRLVPLLAIVAAIEALIFAWPWSHQLFLLAGGDDPMTYEGYARDILLNGVLMNGGLPPGQGQPFYYQAFYPYFLAALHALFGEGMFGIMLIQRLLAAFTIWKLMEIAVDLSTEAVWGSALAIATLFVCWKLWPLSSDLLSESLYVPLVVAWTASLIRACRLPSRRRTLATGVLGGFAAITRSTVLLSWAVVWPVCWFAWKGTARRGTLLAILAVASLGVFSLIAIRNGIVAHVFAPTSTELGITLLGGNEIPQGVTLDLAARASLYHRLGIGELTAQVIEYAITAPGLFARNLGRKALFALGFYEPYAPGWGYSPVYIAVWTSAVAGLVLAFRAHPAARAASLLPALIALSQFLAVVVVYPKGERLILPVHVLLVPYSAIAAWSAIAALRARRREGS